MVTIILTSELLGKSNAISKGRSCHEQSSLLSKLGLSLDLFCPQCHCISVMRHGMWLSFAPMPPQSHLGEKTQAGLTAVCLCGPTEESALAQRAELACPWGGGPCRGETVLGQATEFRYLQICTESSLQILLRLSGLGCRAAHMAWELSAEEPVCACGAMWVHACLLGGTFAGGRSPSPAAPLSSSGVRIGGCVLPRLCFVVSLQRRCLGRGEGHCLPRPGQVRSWASLKPMEASRLSHLCGACFIARKYPEEVQVTMSTYCVGFFGGGRAILVCLQNLSALACSMGKCVTGTRG